jgi:hypothetical protein
MYDYTRIISKTYASLTFWPSTPGSSSASNCFHCMTSYIFWDITTYNPLEVKLLFGGSCRLHLQDPRISQVRKEQSSVCYQFSRWFLARHCLRSWRWRWHVPPKRWLTFNGIHGVISQEDRTFHNHRCDNFKSYIRYYYYYYYYYY